MRFSSYAVMVEKKSIAYETISFPYTNRCMNGTATDTAVCRSN